MFEAEFFQVEAVCEGVDELDWVVFFNVFLEGLWEKERLVSG